MLGDLWDLLSGAGSVAGQLTTAPVNLGALEVEVLAMSISVAMKGRCMTVAVVGGRRLLFFSIKSTNFLSSITILLSW